MKWALHGTAFESALITYTVEKLPILCFSFNSGVNDFLYCRPKKSQQKTQLEVWIAAEPLI